MIEADLYSKLNTDVTLVGGRVFPLTAPQNVAKPYITYQAISGNSNQCIGGEIYEEIINFQIDIFGDTYSQVKNVKNEVYFSLVGFNSSFSIVYRDGFTEETDLYRQIIEISLKDI